MPISEFQLIEKYFTRQSVTRADVLLGVGDDCALLRAPTDEVLAVSIDTLVSGVHFLPDIEADDLGYRALAVNLSDLAAMGARPAWATLALTLPEANETWLERFAAGFFSLAREHDVQLVGGNMARGPLSVTIQVHGFVPAQQALRRAGAQPGDLIFVTGTVGDAALGLKVARNEIVAPPSNAEYLLRRYQRPTPRVAQGLALRGIASAAIDISDGLLADLGHLLASSGVGARVVIDDVPVSAAYRAACEPTDPWALSGGDDYELCFTAPPEKREEVLRTVPSAACIGIIESPLGLRCVRGDGKSDVPRARGYDHFAND